LLIVLFIEVDMEIVKASGERVKFRKNKIIKSAIQAGASRELAKRVANKVKNKIHDGTDTEKILELTLKYLREEPDVALRYDLKRAIMNLGPSGFPFEEYFSQILRNYGYETKRGVHVMGNMVPQEIDVVAIKEKTSMIETKYHNSRGIRTDTKVAMYTYARFLDVKNNPKYKFSDAWLVTNTHCTHRARRYSEGVGTKIISWSYPKKGNLQELIEEKGLYPITIFRCISEDVKHKLFDANIVLAKDLIRQNISKLVKETGLNVKVLDKIISEVESLCKKTL